jgi:hypothetical protein
MAKHKVRFNLGRGENYMKWKVTYNTGRVEYHHPSEVQLVLHKCTLKNNRKAAQRIFSGETTKVVCAHIMCERVEIVTTDFSTETTAHIKYNPRVLPFWNLNGMNVDGNEYKELFTVDYKLFLK